MQERNFVNRIKIKFKKIKHILKQAQKNAIFEENNLKKEMKNFAMEESSQIK